MKVLTAAEMRDVDRRTMELGISGPILMENAGHRVVEFLAERFHPLESQRIVILCGKGNNGGDGLVIARQLFTRFAPASLEVVMNDPQDDSEPLRMLKACGFTAISGELRPEHRVTSLVIDAVLGTGVTGAPRGRALEFIRAINTSFPLAKVVAVDIPSGMPSDGDPPAGDVARADFCVTFTAPKLSQVLAPNANHVGEWVVGAIGTPASLLDSVQVHLTQPADFAALLAPRNRDGNKGKYGHVLVIGGAEGKTGAAEMAGLAALRAGAGLVTVACSDQRLRHPELMTAPLPHDRNALSEAAERKTVLAVGPGLGTSDEAKELVGRVLDECGQPTVIDADALNILAAMKWDEPGRPVVLTPHPGEMSRLTGLGIPEIQADRIGVAREYARGHGCVLVLKGEGTVIAFPDGRAWINPTGSPAMATGGSGDILTGITAGFLAQFPDNPEPAILAAVYLHGLAGELGAKSLGEQALIATDLLRYLPEAMRACARL
jgi:ADP-dependent NAD(P)H-hydrate dehydratase / NAD(P)H-hydrate epimerase